MQKEIGIVGLGKMGAGIALQLQKKGWRVIGKNRSPEKTRELAKEGIIATFDTKEFVQAFTHSPRVVWLMVPAGQAVDDALFGQGGLVNHLERGDILIDAGNSHYTKTQKRYEQVEQHGIRFIDCGVSGGPSGARHGACCMIGGSVETFSYLEPLFQTVCVDKGYAHFSGNGAGHFVKMVHNGIEYGMMQALGEGFGVMKESPFKLNLTDVAQVYNHGSVITSRLMGWLHEAYRDWGEDLAPISGTIGHSGEGEWTIQAAGEMNIEVPVIKQAFDYRLQSNGKPNYIGKVVSALRGKFGGHPVKKE
ncbi:decarboxylating 6-phosphogluconate dehydrogenase [Candidatus Woesebacteria bacterium]|nr:decarboxylating 6-phosphogluconate dehydrogenase [Candidatus Woesebacteria bacterium]